MLFTPHPLIGTARTKAKFYTGVVREETLQLVDGGPPDPPRYLPKKRPLPEKIAKAIKETETQLSKLKRIEDLQQEERCRCARFGTEEPKPHNRVPPIGHVSQLEYQ